jgi:hypothetical protein
MGEIRVQGNKLAPVFIMELYNETIDKPIIKYLNCNRTSNDSNYKVKPDSDFAKLLRLTTGEIANKRFSKAFQLKNHFLGYWFIAEFELYQPPKGPEYFKVSHIKPETPIRNDAWTIKGTLKKTRKKPSFAPLEAGDKEATKGRQVGENEAINKRQVGEQEALQTPISLGLEPVFQSTNKDNSTSNVTNTQDHVVSDDIFLNQTINVFHYSRLENETTNDYFDRVIEISFKPETWAN